jgi:hypothetical protein
MTTRDTRKAFLKLLDGTWPGVQSEFVAAMKAVQSQADMKALEAAIARGDVDAAFRALRFDAADLFKTDTAITAAMVAGGNYQMGAFQHATRRAPIANRVVQSFGGRNERTERIALDLGSKLVTEVLDDTRVLIAQTIRAGLEAGAGPLRTALDIGGRVVNGKRQGGLVGLHSTQAEYVQNMRTALSSTNGVGVRRIVTDPVTGAQRAVKDFWIGRDGTLKSTFTLRNKQSDAAIFRAIRDGTTLPQSAIDRAAQGYSNNLLRQRGETIARTETMKALSAGRHEAVAQLIENPNNDVRAEDTKGKWDSAGDGKVRATHAAANGQTVQYGEPFIVGGYSMLHPLDSSLGAPAEEIIQCRCYEEIIIDFFARLT